MISREVVLETREMIFFFFFFLIVIFDYRYRAKELEELPRHHHLFYRPHGMTLSVIIISRRSRRISSSDAKVFGHVPSALDNCPLSSGSRLAHKMNRTPKRSLHGGNWPRRCGGVRRLTAGVTPRWAWSADKRINPDRLRDIPLPKTG